MPELRRLGRRLTADSSSKRSSPEIRCPRSGAGSDRVNEVCHVDNFVGGWIRAWVGREWTTSGLRQQSRVGSAMRLSLPGAEFSTAVALVSGDVRSDSAGVRAMKRNPKLVAALLVVGTAVLVVGVVLTASWPSGHGSKPGGRVAPAAASNAGSALRPSPAAESNSPAPSSPAPSAGVPPRAGPLSDGAAPAPAGAPPTAAAASKKPVVGRAPSFTYVVKPGDTLFGIAQWFRLHGYGDLYASNIAAVGSDPNLIRPGERITVTGGVWTMRPPA